MQQLSKWIFTLGCLLASSVAAADVTIEMRLTQNSSNQSIGTITAKDTQYGLLLSPSLTHLPPGPHGFHIHEQASCADAGLAAGPHLDPDKTDQHAGPYTPAGHLGDMPVIIADKDGYANQPVLAPRLKVADLQGHAIMIHANNDNYTDKPALGGSGARIACGVVK